MMFLMVSEPKPRAAIFPPVASVAAAHGVGRERGQWNQKGRTNLGDLEKEALPVFISPSVRTWTDGRDIAAEADKLRAPMRGSEVPSLTEQRPVQVRARICRSCWRIVRAWRQACCRRRSKPGESLATQNTSTSQCPNWWGTKSTLSLLACPRLVWQGNGYFRNCFTEIRFQAGVPTSGRFCKFPYGVCPARSILRHAKIQTTLDLYTQDDSDETLAAQGEYLTALGVDTYMVQ